MRETFVPSARLLPCVNSALNVQNVQNLNVNCQVYHAPFVAGQLQRKG